MLCKKPFLRGIQPFGCGQCLPCRISRRRLWAHRLVLESYKHSAASFVTLTYKPEALPPGGTLVPKHTQDWLKRLRKALGPRGLRFFLVGEYGEESGRPHYHAALFGVRPCVMPLNKKCLWHCEDCKLVHDTWGQGVTHNGELTPDSAQYVAGYVTKKMTSDKSAFQREFLKGRFPEFARMSLKPGIGSLAVSDLANVLVSEHGASSIIERGDVPSVLQHGKKKLPLGRYLKRKLREELGFKEIGAQESTLLELQVEMSVLFEDALSNPENKSKSLKQILIDMNKQKIANLESKSKIFDKRKSL